MDHPFGDKKDRKIAPAFPPKKKSENDDTFPPSGSYFRPQTYKGSLAMLKPDPLEIYAPALNPLGASTSIPRLSIGVKEEHGVSVKAKPSLRRRKSPKIQPYKPHLHGYSTEQHDSDIKALTDRRASAGFNFMEGLSPRGGVSGSNGQLWELIPSRQAAVPGPRPVTARLLKGQGPAAASSPSLTDLPPIVHQEEEIEYYYVPPECLKSVASLLTNFNAGGNPAEYLQTNLPRIMRKFVELDAFIIVELFFECIDRQDFMDTVILVYRQTGMAETFDWSMFARCELHATIYLIFFEAKRLSSDNLFTILTEFKWKGTRSFYKFLLHEFKKESHLLHAIQMIYAREYLDTKVIPNISYAKFVLRRVLNAVLMDTPENQRPVTRGVTVPKPFRFHVTIPKEIDYEPVAQAPFRANVVPKSQFISPRPDPKYERALQKNRDKAQSLLLAVNNLDKKSSLYGEATKSEKYLKSIERVKAEREAEKKRSAKSAPRTPLEKVLKEPRHKGKTTMSELLRQRQLCVHDEERQRAEIEQLLLGRNEEKIRNYIDTRNAESEQMERIKKARLVCGTKISHQNALIAPRRLKQRAQEKAKEFREELKIADHELKLSQETELRVAKAAARKAARKEKAAELTAKLKMEKKHDDLAEENLAYARKVKEEALLAIKEEEDRRIEKVLKVKACEAIPMKNAGVKEPEREETMPPAEVSVRIDFKRQELVDKLATISEKLEVAKRNSALAVERMRQDVEACKEMKRKRRLAAAAAAAVVPQPPPDPQVEALHVQLRALVEENERYLEAELKAQERARKALEFDKDRKEDKED